MRLCGILLLLLAAALPCPAQNVSVSGELKQWHKITLTADGPFARESDTNPNPFLDYRFFVVFRHESAPENDSRGVYGVHGYFAADGNAGDSSATEGDKWRAHFSPDRTGKWTYRIQFVRGAEAAINPNASTEPVTPLDGATGSFVISPSDKSGRDFRAAGRLGYAQGRYLRFEGSGLYFLKVGPDSPESLLAYEDFDGTQSKPGTQRSGEAAPTGLHRYEAHRRDWREGDPTWKDGKGKGLIGGLNYLASKGCNAFSFLTYNAGGDGDNVWPFVSRNDKLHYDCSKLDQWQIVFDHAQKLGLYLHFKLQETEMDDERIGPERKAQSVPTALDGGAMGRERKLYVRELIARFGHALALNWNLGEENTQSSEEVREMAKFFAAWDPYDHHIVLHTYPQEQDRVYNLLLGENSALTGVSLQNNWNVVHERTLKWIQASRAAGKPWVVANDEQGPSDLGVPPDPGYQGHSGEASRGTSSYNLHDIRKLTLWGNLMAGGAGVEYYFGYRLPENDLGCEDWRSRDQSWEFGRIALEFFYTNNIPFWEMENTNPLIGNERNDNSKYSFSKVGEIYLVYLPNGGEAELRLDNSEDFSIHLFNPRLGGALVPARAESASPRGLKLSAPDQQDWLFVVRKK